MAQQLGPAVVEAATSAFQFALSTKSGCECVAHCIQALCETDPQLTPTSSGWGECVRPHLKAGETKFGQIQVWPRVVTKFGQTNFGQDQVWPRPSLARPWPDQVWPRPSLARPSLAKTKFGQTKCGTINIVREGVAAQTRQMSAFRFNGPSCGASPEGRRCST